MKKFIMLLVGAFVLISVIVAIGPEITDITVTDNTSQIPAAAAAGLNIAKWLVLLAAGVGTLMLGIVYLRKRGK